MPSNCDCWKNHNRDMICEACHDFRGREHGFAGCPIVTRFWENVTRFSVCWVCFQDKVGRTLGRTQQPCHDLANRVTIWQIVTQF